MKQHVKNRMEMRGEGGFTLIELLVVIAILGILSAVVVFAVGNTTDKAQKKACKTERNTLKTAIEAYRSDDPLGAYPSAFLSLTAAKGYLDSEASAGEIAGRWGYSAADYSATGAADGLSENESGKCKDFDDV